MDDLKTLSDVISFCDEYFVTIRFELDTIKFSIEGFALVECRDLVDGANKLKNFVDTDGGYLRRKSKILEYRAEKQAMMEKCREHMRNWIRTQ